MKSIRCLFVHASLYSLFFGLVCEAAEPRTLEDALLNYTWTWERPTLVNTWTKVKFLSGGRFVGVDGSGNWAKVTTTWSKLGPNSVLVAGNKTLVFDKDFRSYTGSSDIDVFTGKRIEPEPAFSTIQTDANQPRIEVIKDQGPNATEWALTPLDEAVPADIRQNLTFLREDLLDEGKKAAKSSPEAYKLASDYCDKLLAALSQREISRVQAGYQAAQANANKATSTQALDARRNHQMSWPQFSREESQRAALRESEANKADVKKQRLKVEWATRAEQMRSYLDNTYRQLREAMR